MKTQKAMRVLLAAFALLVGISSTDAALCTSTAFAGAVDTCLCPPGMGPAGSLVSALPTLPGVGYGGAGATAGAQLIKAKAALAKCVDLLPGYAQTTTNKVLPTACTTADFYCPGHINIYDGAFCAGSDTAYTGVELKSTYTALAAGVKTKLKSDVKVACPSNSATAGSAPFDMTSCVATTGYYVASIITGAGVTQGLPTISQCPAGSVCPTPLTAASTVAESTPVSCDLASGGNTKLTPGGFICPLGTTGVLGTSISASLASITGEIICGTGSGPKHPASTATCDTFEGFYGGTTSATGTGTPSTTPARTACPTGTTGTAAATRLATCTDLAGGYEVITPIAGQYVPGSLAALEAGITVCPSPDKYCPGQATQFSLVGTDDKVTYDTVPKSVAGKATACPTGIGNSLTGATAQGVNAVSLQAGCLDLLPSYGLLVGSTKTALADIIIKCVADRYGCAGSASLFIDYSPSTVTMAATNGINAANNGDLRLASASTLPSATTTSGGTLVATDCPGVMTSPGTGLKATCVTAPGTYIDVSDVKLQKTCPINHYCVGGQAFGTAGGSSECPTGSVGSAASTTESSSLSDCKLSEGFYIASALSTPVPCLADSVCAGGGPVGVSGGLVACPAGSTNTACSASATTTVNLTPASQPITVDVAAPVAAAAPDITFTNTASSASSTVASMVVVTVAAMVAL